MTFFGFPLIFYKKKFYQLKSLQATVENIYNSFNKGMQFYTTLKTYLHKFDNTFENMDAVLRHTQDVTIHFQFKCQYKVRNLDAVLRHAQDAKVTNKFGNTIGLGCLDTVLRHVQDVLVVNMNFEK